MLCVNGRVVHTYIHMHMCTHTHTKHKYTRIYTDSVTTDRLTQREKTEWFAYKSARTTRPPIAAKEDIQTDTLDHPAGRLAKARGSCNCCYRAVGCVAEHCKGSRYLSRVRPMILPTISK